MTDAQRVVQWFRDHPGSSRFEAQIGLHGVHVTARMSDARKLGVTFAKWRDPENPKVTLFRIVDPEPIQAVLFFAELGV